MNPKAGSDVWKIPTHIKQTLKRLYLKVRLSKSHYWLQQEQVLANAFHVYELNTRFTRDEGRPSIQMTLLRPGVGRNTSSWVDVAPSWPHRKSTELARPRRIERVVVNFRGMTPNYRACGMAIIPFVHSKVDRKRIYQLAELWVSYFPEYTISWKANYLQLDLIYRVRLTTVAMRPAVVEEGESNQVKYARSVAILAGLVELLDRYMEHFGPQPPRRKRRVKSKNRKTDTAPDPLNRPTVTRRTAGELF